MELKKWHFLFGLLFLICLNMSAQNRVTQIKLNTRHWGGVTPCIAVNPNHPNDILIGTDIGGLYRSTDQGHSWIYQEAFPTYGIRAVSFCPADPNIILVTANFDTKTDRAGGVFRSTNGGLDWTRPDGSISPVTSRCPERCSAFGISWVPGTSTVWVATDCGLLRSTNRGEHFDLVVVEPLASGAYDRWDQRFRPDRMFSVLAIDENHVIAGGENGYYYMHDGSTWHKSLGAQPNFYCPRGLTISPNDQNLLFRADYNSAYLQYSSDMGVSWHNFPVSGLDAGNIPPFVRTTTSPRGSEYFEVYFGTGTKLKRSTLSYDTSTWASSTWDQLSIDHDDPLDIGFHPNSGRPILLSADSGVMQTMDDGASWHSTGAGSQGLNALEIYGLGVQRLNTHPQPQTDITFITWHNNAWHSTDKGATWTMRDIWEGINIRTSGPELNETADIRVSLLPWAQSANLYGKGITPLSPGFVPPRDASKSRHILFFQDPISHKHIVLNATYDCDGASVIYDKKAIQENRWKEVIRGQEAMKGYAQIAYHGNQVSLYQAYASGSNLLLLKINNVNAADSGTPSISRPAMRNFGGISVMPTNGNEPVFAVKPDDDQIIIAADLHDSRMKRSINGGESWVESDLLTRLVVDDGRLRFSTVGNRNQATVIAFNPYDPNKVFVGTIQSGVLYSVDGGVSWDRIIGSEAITNVVDIRFDKDNTVYFASAGKGLWKWSARYLRRFPRKARRHILVHHICDPMGGRSLSPEFLEKLEYSPGCTLILGNKAVIDNFYIDQKEQKLFVYSKNPGDLVIYQAHDSKIEIEVVSENSAEEFRDCEPCRQDVEKGLLVHGLILEGDKIVAYVSADQKSWELPNSVLYADEMIPDLKPSLTLYQVTRGPGTQMAKQGESITVVGSGFAPINEDSNDPGLISVYLNGQLVLDKVETDTKGSFKVGVDLKTIPGPGTIACVQNSLRNRLVAEEIILVMNRDDEQKEVEKE